MAKAAKGKKVAAPQVKRPGFKMVDEASVVKETAEQPHQDHFVRLETVYDAAPSYRFLPNNVEERLETAGLGDEVVPIPLTDGRVVHTVARNLPWIDPNATLYEALVLAKRTIEDTESRLGLCLKPEADLDALDFLIAVEESGLRRKREVLRRALLQNPVFKQGLEDTGSAEKAKQDLSGDDRKTGVPDTEGEKPARKKRDADRDRFWSHLSNLKSKPSSARAAARSFIRQDDACKESIRQDPGEERRIERACRDVFEEHWRQIHDKTNSDDWSESEDF